MRSLTKLCADHLRSYSSSHGVKLKSAHAHELVASFFGYKSKAAMQSDVLSPIDNLNQAQILVLVPSLFIEERRKCLENLPIDLSDTYKLGEEMFTCLATENLFSGRVFASWSHLAKELTKEFLQDNSELKFPQNFEPRTNPHQVFNKPVYEFNPTIESINNSIKLTSSNRYYGSSDVHFQPIDVTLSMELKRIAGYVGYTTPEISLINMSHQKDL